MENESSPEMQEISPPGIWIIKISDTLAPRVLDFDFWEKFDVSNIQDMEHGNEAWLNKRSCENIVQKGSSRPYSAFE